MGAGPGPGHAVGTQRTAESLADEKRLAAPHHRHALTTVRQGQMRRQVVAIAMEVDRPALRGDRCHRTGPTPWLNRPRGSRGRHLVGDDPFSGSTPRHDRPPRCEIACLDCAVSWSPTAADAGAVTIVGLNQECLPSTSTIRRPQRAPHQVAGDTEPATATRGLESGVETHVSVTT